MAYGYAPLAVARRQPVRPHRGPRRPASTSIVARRRGRRAAEARPRSPAEDAAHRRRGRRRDSDDPSRRGTASGGRSAGCPTVPGSRRSARARRVRRTCGCCRCPGVAPEGARPRQVTDSPPRRPAAPRWPRARSPRANGSRSRPATACASRARSGGRPAATGKRGGRRVPTIVYPARRPDLAGVPVVRAVPAAARARGLSPFLDVDFRGSTGLRPRLPPGQPRRVGPRRRPRRHRRRAGGRPTSRGRTDDWRSTAGRTAGTWCCAPWSRSRRCGRAGDRPVRRFGDRGELPPRRPARAASTSRR